MKKNIFLLVGLFLISGCAAAGVEAIPQFDTGVDPASWGLIPAGEFLQGQHNLETELDYDYEVMVTDVTNVMYADYLNEALAQGKIMISDNQVLGYYAGDAFNAYEHEFEIAAGDWLHVPIYESGLRLSYESGIFQAMSGYENHPMVMVTWFGAKAFCEYYGWRLPSELEWEKAARGQDGRPYPWGDEINPQYANYYSSHDLFEKIVGGLGDTSPVGFYNGSEYAGFQTENAVSPYGLYDMAGNVWQWTGDVYPDQHYRYMRGGSKADYSYNLRVWMRNNAGPDYYSTNAGFRCARNAAP